MSISAPDLTPCSGCEGTGKVNGRDCGACDGAGQSALLGGKLFTCGHRRTKSNSYTSASGSRCRMCTIAEKRPFKVRLALVRMGLR